MSSCVDICKIGKKVTSEKFSDFLKKKVLRMWNCNKDVFPSNTPVCITREDFGKLKEYPYFVSYHNNSQNVMLFFTTDYFNNKVCFLCNRKFEFFRIDLSCYNDSVYLDSLFDCQIEYYTEDLYTLFLNDCVYIYGENMKNSQFDARLTNIDRFLTVDGIRPPVNLGVIIKPFFKFEDIFHFLNSLDRENIYGITLIPNKLPLSSGSQKNNFYWVNKGNHVVDLLVSEAENSIEIFCYNFRKPFKYAIGDKSLLEIVKNLPGYKNGCIIEFIINYTLFPVRVKPEKEFPCGLRVIESILYSINQDIKLDELENM